MCQRKHIRPIKDEVYIFMIEYIEAVGKCKDFLLSEKDKEIYLRDIVAMANHLAWTSAL